MRIIVNENDPTDVKILTDDGIDLVKKLSIRRVEVKLEPNEFPKVDKNDPD
jgi:hypothetical protein